MIGDPTKDPNVWIWIGNTGIKALIYDEGKDKCSFVSILRMPTQEEAVKHAYNFRPEDLLLLLT
jgi:hypothetical protein